MQNIKKFIIVLIMIILLTIPYNLEKFVVYEMNYNYKFKNKINLLNLTQDQINSLTNNTVRDTVFNTTTKRINIYNGTKWIEASAYINNSNGEIVLGNNNNNYSSTNSILIGYNNQVQANNSILINATKDNIATTGNRFYVNPIKNAKLTNALKYNTNTKEITYSPIISTSTNNVKYIVGDIAPNKVDETFYELNGQILLKQDFPRLYYILKDTFDFDNTSIISQGPTTNISLPIDIKDIIWNENPDPLLARFIVTSNTPGGVFWVSSDFLQNWVSHQLPNLTNILKIKYLNNQFICFGTNGTNMYLYVSTDTITWTLKVLTPVPSTELINYNNLGNIHDIILISY